MKNKKTKKRSANIIKTALIILSIVIINLISSKAFFRLDLTGEKRYTISEGTREILTNLEDVVVIRIYLDGELNIPFQNFQNSIVELLDEFHVYGRNNLHYEFVDPFDKLSEQDLQNVLADFESKGLKVSNIYQRKKDGSKTEKLILPGASIIYNGTEISLNLLVNNPSKSGEENLNSSIETLEYKFINTINNITSTEIEKIAFLEGHSEWPDPFVADIMKELSKAYQVDRGIMDGRPGILNAYSAIVVAGPVVQFTEQDKYVIDQYIMQGGKVLWLLDAVNVDFDSLSMGRSLAYPNMINLDDMFFKYGIRINPNIIQDAQCSRLPVNVALQGEAPRFQAEPWNYYPLISPQKSNLITNNINDIQLRFASTIDTIQARKNIKKTPLLVSSFNSKIQKTPRIVELQEISTPITEINYDSPNQLVGVLLEGEFESVFNNRMIDEYFSIPPLNRLNTSVETKMIVVSDADIIRNEIKRSTQGSGIFPLGFDRLTNQTYGNKEFLVNALNYLTGNDGLLELRGREFKLRLLDRKKLSNERVKWQIINVVMPILLIVLLGIAYSFMRKRRYTRQL